jgi:hypothetical protein
MTALTQILQASPDLAGVKVKDMGDLTDADALAVVTIGMLNPNEDSHAEATMVRGAMSWGDQRETYHIHCGLAVATGDEDQGGGAARKQAFGMLAAVGSALAANKTLRGVVMSALLDAWALRVDQTTAGYRAQMTFEVAVDAFTNR